jgi:hypothetical protein
MIWCLLCHIIDLVLLTSQLSIRILQQLQLAEPEKLHEIELKRYSMVRSIATYPSPE